MADLLFFELRDAQFEIQLEFEVGVIPVAADIAEQDFNPGFADLGNQVQPALHVPRETVRIEKSHICCPSPMMEFTFGPG